MKNISRYQEEFDYQPKSSKKYRPVKRPEKGSFSKGFLWGAVIGGILGVLFAPDNGENTRKKIKKTAKEYEGKGKEALEKAKIEMEKAKEKYEELRMKAEPVVEKAKESIVNIKEVVEEKKDPLLNNLENFAEDIEDEAKKLKKRYFSGVRKK